MTLSMKTALLVLLASWLLAACSATEAAPEAISVSGGSYMEVTARTLNDMLAQKDFVFINVHVPFAGNIAKTDLSIPYDRIEASLSQLPADKNARIVLYCRSGRMSTIAAEKLVSLGYTNVWNLKGGMVDWENAGYKLEQ
jgi:rhodanese-related sulfurtransferase